MIKRMMIALACLPLLTGHVMANSKEEDSDLKAYRLNLVFFEHLSEPSREVLSPQPEKPELSFDRVVLPDEPLLDNQLRPEPDTHFDLADETLRLRRSRAYKVIWSGAVTLVMPGNTEQKLRIDGPNGAQGLPLFQARVDFRRSLYLHAGITFTVPAWAPWTHDWLDYVLPADRRLSRHGYMPVPAPLAQSGADKRLIGWWVMQQTQRLKIGKTTYYDHPRFSALVHVERAELPQPASEQSENAGDPLSQPPVPLTESP
ncbi:MAG: hypothetical protein D6758_02830 [Gammaproteobacteria bacterium]|nr:MAG: hypothetical protein D6758_02830 [Gammaproteobacteria bacterium]